MSMSKKKGPGQYERKGSTIIGLFEMFLDSGTAEEWFERQRWGDSPRCTACDSERVSSMEYLWERLYERQFPISPAG